MEEMASGSLGLAGLAAIVARVADTAFTVCISATGGALVEIVGVFRYS